MLDIKEVSPNQFDEIWPIFQEVALSGETYPICQPSLKKKKSHNGSHLTQGCALPISLPNPISQPRSQVNRIYTMDRGRGLWSA